MSLNTGGFDLMFQARQAVVNAVLVPLLDQLPNRSSFDTIQRVAAKQITAPMQADGTWDPHDNLLSLFWSEPQVTLEPCSRFV
jgi:hypothetical protein